MRNVDATAAMWMQFDKFDAFDHKQIGSFSCFACWGYHQWLFLVPLKGGIGSIFHPPQGKDYTWYISGTLPKLNIAPEKWWLEDYIPIGVHFVTFQGFFLAVFHFGRVFFLPT